MNKDLVVLTLSKLLITCGYTCFCYRSWLLSVSSFYWVNIVILSFQRSFVVLSLIVFNRFLKSCVLTSGFNANNFLFRSFRQRGANFAFSCGAPTEFIKEQGDWQSDAYLIYLKLSTQKKLDMLHTISAQLSHISL